MNLLKGLTAVLLLAGLVACSESAQPIKTQYEPSPLASQEFYVDTLRQVDVALQKATGPKAEALKRIAAQPTAFWAAGAADNAREVTRITKAAAQQNKLALIVVYNIPQRDCGQYSKGGAPNAAAYRQWLNIIAAAVQGPAVFIVEPDAVGHMFNAECKIASVNERSALLARAIEVFKAVPHVRAVYLDSANPRWIPNSRELVHVLHSAGIAKADGVAVNVSNFVPKAEVEQWVSRLLDGLVMEVGYMGAIIDTSRNGNNVYASTGENSWCNPPGRKLGNAPTTTGLRPHVHAYVWAKPPGESDGDCGRGNPPAGTFWVDYAVGLAS